MNIAEKAQRIQSGEDSQHGTHHADLPERPEAITRLRALLRGDPQAWSSPAPTEVTDPVDSTHARSSSTPKTGSAAAVPEAKDLTEMTVAELTDEIRRRNDLRPDDDRLLVSGSKAELLDRLIDDEFEYPSK